MHIYGKVLQYEPGRLLSFTHNVGKSYAHSQLHPFLGRTYCKLNDFDQRMQESHAVERSTSSRSSRWTEAVFEGANVMTDRELLESMSAQMGELVRHVAEVRQSNFTMQAQLSEMQADMKVMRADVNALRSDVDALRSDVDALRSDVDALRSDVDALRSDVDALRADVDGMQVRLHNLEIKIDERSEFLGGKIDHFIGVFHEEIVRDRTRFQEDRYVRDALQKKTDARLDDIESRLTRLEAAVASR